MSAPAATVADLRERARRRLPRMVFDFVDGGAEDEVTLRANRRPSRRLHCAHGCWSTSPSARRR